ncbi:alpha-amylase family protein [Microbacterium halophytorum]|uniref:alpha-amylase family protein n=1 Tax=Microbacterium halophytorum TaxID=2067568 RepID=UPI000CFBFE1E|nr:alpha-amylase family protein [Microbacterium halophytorum]
MTAAAHRTQADTQRRLPTDSRWRQPFQVLQTNLQPVDALMNVEEAVTAVLDSGAGTWLLNGGGILSFYPTDLPFQTREPLLRERPSGDLLGDAVTEAHTRGVAVVARFDMSKLSAEIAAEHPEWLYRAHDGSPQIYNGLASACPSAAYYQERTFDVLDEVLDRYDIDGVFFNWFNFNERDYSEVMHGPCHCEACLAGFAAFSGGAEHPEGMRSPTFGKWRQYTASVLAELTARIADHVAARDRDIAVVLRRGAPVEYLEGNNAFRAMPGKELWPYATGEAVSAATATDPEAAVLVNCVAFVESTYRMAPEDPEHFAHHLLQAIARGGNPSVYYFGAPGRLPMGGAISTGCDVMRFRREHRAVYEGMRTAAEIALARPDFGSAPPGGYWDLVEEFRGVYQALTERHLAFDVVPVDRLGSVAAAGGLDTYSLVVLPDLGGLRGAGAALDGWVERGGSLLVTGGSGIADDGVELRSSPTTGRAASPLTGTELRSSYASTSAQPRAEHLSYDGPMVPVAGKLERLDWAEDAERFGSILPQAPFGPPEYAFGHAVGEDPVWAVRRVGNGASAIVPWTIGRTYREFAKTDARDLLVEIVRALVQPAVEFDAHEAVELVANRSGDDLIVHLINHSGLRRRSYGPHVPIDGAHLRLRGRAHDDVAVRALRAGIRLDARKEGDDLVIPLPRLGLFEVVTVSAR